MPITSAKRRIAAIYAGSSPDSAVPVSVPGALLRWFFHRPAILHAEQRNRKTASMNRAWLTAILSREDYCENHVEQRIGLPIQRAGFAGQRIRLFPKSERQNVVLMNPFPKTSI